MFYHLSLKISLLKNCINYEVSFGLKMLQNLFISFI